VSKKDLRLAFGRVVSGLGIGVWGSGLRVQGAGFRVQGSGVRVWAGDGRGGAGGRAGARRLSLTVCLSEDVRGDWTTAVERPHAI